MKVETPGDVRCTTTGGYGSTKQTNCTQDTKVKYEQRCTETPVSISLPLEKENLKKYENAARSANRQRMEAYRNCHNHVSAMSPEEAYRYYSR